MATSGYDEAATEMAGGSGTNNELSEAFEKGLELHTALENASTLPGSKEYQDDVKKAIKLLEEATQMVNQLGMFSSNESIEEVATADIKYLLLPAILGSLTGKLMVENRLDVIKVSEVYFKDFIRRCKDYGVVEIDVPDEELRYSETEEMTPRSLPTISDLQEMARKRQSKIDRYKEQKDLEKKLEDMKKHIGSLSIDDEVLRNYYLMLLKRWINVALNELSSIQMEKPILLHMANIKKGDGSESSRKKKENRPQPKPLKPIIITRNDLQKKVYGLGYPSIPTMTIEEFFQEKVKEGDLKEGDMSSLICRAENPEKAAQEEEKQDVEEESKIERDDPDKLRRLREFDDWKDDHRRGWGNRKNMG